MTLVDLPIPADETTLAEQVIARYSELDPDWDPAEGDLETIVAEAVASPFATAIEVLRLTARGAYADIVGRVVRTERAVAISATAIVSLTVDTSAGVTIPAGTEFTLTLDGDEVPFILPAPVVIAGGATTASGVTLAAADVGESLNGATGPAKSGHARVSAVTVSSSAGGGLDEQSEDDFVEELERRSRRVSFAPVSAPDYASVTLDDEEVGRCAYKNRYDPSAPGVESLGHVTVWPIKLDGSNLSAPALARVEAMFVTDDQPLNVTTHVIASIPRVTINVAVTVEGNKATYSDAEITAAVQGAIAAAIDDAAWDYDLSAPGLWTPTAATVRHFDIVSAVDDLVEVRRVTAATVNGGTSVALTAPVSLPTLGTVAVTVS